MHYIKSIDKRKLNESNGMIRGLEFEKKSIQHLKVKASRYCVISNKPSGVSGNRCRIRIHILLRTGMENGVRS